MIIRQHRTFHGQFAIVLFALAGIAPNILALNAISDVAGTPNSAGFSGDSGLATSAQFDNPVICAHDSNGNLFVADATNQRIRRIDAATHVITTFAGTGQAGFFGDNGQAINAQFNSPIGLVFDSTNNLYVSDQGNNRVRKIDTTGVITTIAGNGSSTSGADGVATMIGIATPGSLAYDKTGGILVGELNGYRIRRISLTNGMATTYAGNGQSGFSGDTGPANAAKIGAPAGMKFNTTGNFYFIDSGNQRVRMVTSNGNISTIAGTGASGFSGDNGPALSATFAFSSGGSISGGLGIDPSGTLYLTDYYNQRVRTIQSDNIVRTICGTGTAGYNGTSMNALTAELNGPQCAEFFNNQLFFTDETNQIVRSITFNVTPPSSPPVITSFTSSQNPAYLYQTVPFTFTATDSATSTLTYMLNYGDGSTVAAGSFTQGTPVTVNYAYSTYSNTGYTVTLTVSDGFTPVTQTLTQTVPAPNSGASSIINVGQGATPVMTPVAAPLGGMIMSVGSSNGGVIQLNIDVNSVARSAFSCSTLFGDSSGHSSIAAGVTPVHQFIKHGIYVAKTDATDIATQQVAGEQRLTLAISTAETGEASPEYQHTAGKQRTPNSVSSSITTKSLKGKFAFSGAAADTVGFTGTIQLTSGFDTTKSHEVWLAIGNIVVQTTINPKGIGLTPGSPATLRNMKLTTKVKKGQISKGGELATLSATYSLAGMVANGFDTEGISAQSTDVGKNKQAMRMIQLAMLIDGVPYLTLVPVEFSLSGGNGFGNISGRSAK